MNYGGLTLRDLDYIVAVADLGGFSAAAEQCGVSQPSLSAQVRKVEAQLGVTVFERQGRKTTATAAGLRVLAQARLILSEARRLFDVAKTFSDPLDGPLHLGVIATLAPYFVPHLLEPLQKNFSGLRLALKESQTLALVADLAAGNLDAALLSLPVDNKRLETRALFFEPFVVIHPLNSRLALCEDVEISDIDNDEMILMEEGHCLRGQTLQICRAAPAAGEARHAASIETLRHLVAAGSGHSLLPRLAVKYDPLIDDLVRYRPLRDAGIGRAIALAWRKTDPRREAYHRLCDTISGIGLPGTTSI